MCSPSRRSHHVVLVLQEDAELFEEGDHQHQQLLILPLQRLDQQMHNVLVPHLELRACVLRQIQQQVERN